MLAQDSMAKLQQDVARLQRDLDREKAEHLSAEEHSVSIESDLQVYTI